MFNGDASTRTLYVGNLDPMVSEDLLMTLFGTLGQCKGCKLIREAGSELYAFIEFNTHTEAQMALMAMNKRNVLGKELKVNWATQPGGQIKQDTSKHFHIFVGDLTPDIEAPQLKEAFAPFGEISDAKIITDPQTGRSKGFGFVCFVRKEDAEMAITGMNGTWLGGRTIRTNWATGKGVMSTSMRPQQSHYKELNYNEVQNQSGPNNTTVYCGGITSETTDSMMKEAFQSYGEIVEVRVFKEKGYAFVRYSTKDAAVRAICGVHGTDINGSIVKCSWGKEQAELQQQIANSQQMKSASLAAATSQAGGFYPPPPVPGAYWGYPGYPTTQNAFMSPFGMQGYGGFPQASSTWSSQPSQQYAPGTNGTQQPSQQQQQPQGNPGQQQQQSSFSSGMSNLGGLGANAFGQTSQMNGQLYSGKL
ncbi:hypothetical protein HELRODRAFT_97603 [Helobdella robusta]|uniref:RRM domain-containing protein n=1 Tax=Helobdella robusta TaxID=6412 RepID=T1G9I0_HELRO|nr:hypothetical protein HELRODRAFT_97603 [Helobdella robusta]ESO09499.1 hypothetical protein HELRODRAFT_97603 [Helobdella robusta]